VTVEELEREHRRRHQRAIPRYRREKVKRYRREKVERYRRQTHRAQNVEYISSATAEEWRRRIDEERARAERLEREDESKREWRSQGLFDAVDR
jgi:hypothetical protein